ncbi:hypothetical protein BKA64DRAFT_700006 [Cadophora sp. MPI-SDFR-AT-0126]|nr:hypothetical protein BKA64DRAFT_700006 [Leotiomycetes sp. MPI-SDFR-AT-0126]
MAIEYLTFDADGDLLLLLGQPIKPEIDDNEVAGIIDPEFAMSVYEKALDVPMDFIEISDSESGSTTMDLAGEEVIDSEPESEPPLQEMHMLVSSKTLMIASSVFKAMLQKGHFKEGSKLESGKTEISLDDDPAAFKILMDILHFNARKVPRTVDLKTLTNLAVLVDKYSVLEPVEVFAERWIAQLRETMPTTLTKDLLPWICIAWVFQSPEVLVTAVKVALKWSDGMIEASVTQDLPIPESLLNAIEDSRQHLLAEMLRPWQDLIDKYLKPARKNTICREAYPESTKERKKRRDKCDKLMAGSIVRSGLDNELYPPPNAPYHGISLRGMMSSMSLLSFMAECDDPSIEWPAGKKPLWSGHGHTRKIRERMSRLQRSISQVTLEDLVGEDWQDLRETS